MPPPEDRLTLDALRLDSAETVAGLVERLNEIVVRSLRKRGALVAVSGGIDSSVTAALCVEALGAEKVVGLLMPETESSDDTLGLSRLLVEHLGIESVVEDITPVLDAVGCYRRRDEAIRTVVPEYGDGWRAKLVLPSVLGGDRLPVFSVVVESPEGERRQARLSSSAYRAVVAATSFKQRTRKMLEYFHADRLDYAVVGTPNRLEYDQGFFVKCGDGAADVKPVAHLYKTQIYQLAEHLGIPDTIRSRPPTTDTYSLPQTQDEFYFSVPYEVLDLCLYALNHEVPASAIAATVELSEGDVERIFRDIEAKRRATRPLHEPPLLLESVPQISTPPSTGTRSY
jgi:NAD+ synthase